VRILLYDDRLMVEALAGSLRRHGHDVVAMTTTPEDACEAAAERDPDVCVLGASSEGNGTDTVTRIRSSTRSNVLVLSERSDRYVVNTALEAGARGFVSTNQRLSDVLDALDHVCAGEVYVSTGLARTCADAPGEPQRPELAALRFLTGREREALRRIAEGETTKEIALSMCVTYSTARTHVQNVLTKLGVRSRLQAAALVARAGITPRDLADGGVASTAARFVYSSSCWPCSPANAGGDREPQPERWDA
jgi:two-component system nitrate/nitrite response regulator NarL